MEKHILSPYPFSLYRARVCCDPECFSFFFVFFDCSKNYGVFFFPASCVFSCSVHAVTSPGRIQMGKYSIILRVTVDIDVWNETRQLCTCTTHPMRHALDIEWPTLIGFIYVCLLE